MKKFITDDPQGPVEALLNTVFVQGNEVYIRGAAVDGSDMTLCAYCALQ